MILEIACGIAIAPFVLAIGLGALYVVGQILTSETFWNFAMAVGCVVVIYLLKN